MDAPAGFLSPREQEVWAGLSYPARRNKWLIGRIAAKRLLREVLEEQTGAAPPASALTIANEPSGAPYALLEGQGRLPWALSLSHRGELGLCALCTEPGVLLGADLEWVQPRDGALVRTFFTEAEQAQVAAGPQDLTVARIWSAKESLLKAMGLGLRLDTRQVEIEGEAVDEAAPSGWRPLGVRLGAQTPEALRKGFVCAWRDEGDFVLSVALARQSPPRSA